LTYINYIKGLGRRAEKNYEEAQRIIDGRLTGNEIYLRSILSINRGRNGLDNRIETRKSSPRSSKSNPLEDFQQTLEIYAKAEKEMKNELAELASLAHNNLGVYYLNEGIYDDVRLKNI
jgi:hypothetical protein